MEGWLWKQDENLMGTEGSNVELISCDIFDTLVFRTLTRPEDLFLHVATEARARGLMSQGMEPEVYVQLRIAADREARRLHQREVDVDEIYDLLPLDRETRMKMIELELEMEKMHLYLNPSIGSFLEYYWQKGIAIVLLSDMYFRREQLERLLVAAGFDLKLIDEIIVSSETKKTKYGKGRLFEVLLEKYSHISPNRILHIGDNYTSDVINAAKYGIRTIHYKPREDRANAAELEMVRADYVIPSLFSLRKLFKFMTGHLSPTQRFWYEFGATILGPIYTVFTEWIIRTAVRENIGYIYPFMRGGQILSTFLENSLTFNHLDHIRVKPMYISRRSSYLSSIPAIDQGFIDSLLATPWITVGALFRRLNLELESTYEEHEHTRMSETKTIRIEQERSLYDDLRAYLHREDVLQRIRKKQEREQELLFGYLRSEFNLQEPFMTVDIGHAGTIQSALKTLLDKMGLDTKVCHLVAMANQMTVPKLLSGIDIRGLICYPGVNEEVYRSNNWMPGILDELLRENIGSTIGYRKNEHGRIEPVLESIEGSDQHDQERLLVHQGMLDFQRMFLKMAQQKPWMIDELLDQRRKLFWPILRFMEYPTYQEALYLGNLLHENLLDEGNRLEKFCPPELEEKVRQLGPDQFSREGRSSILVWPAGLIARVYPNYFMKQQLYRWSDLNETSMRALELASLVIEQGHQDVVVYGAGEMGRELVRLLQQFGIRITAIVDRNEELWSTHIQGVPVGSFEQALETQVHTFVIASYAYYEEIRNDLLQKSEITGISLNLVDFSLVQTIS